MQHHLYYRKSWQRAEPISLISRLADRFPIQKVLHKSGLNYHSCSLTLKAIYWLVIGLAPLEEKAVPANRIRNKMVFCLIQLDILTSFFPGQQVEQVADVRALQRKGSNELSCWCGLLTRIH